MSESNPCRLCLKVSNKFMRLSVDNGHRSEAYQIALNYFPPKFLNLNQGYVCMECWCHIFLFHKFRDSVLRVHGEFLEMEKHVQQMHPDESRVKDTPNKSANRKNFPCTDDNQITTQTLIKNEDADYISLPDLQPVDCELKPKTNAILSSSLDVSSRRETLDHGPQQKQQNKEIEINLISDDSISSNDDIDQDEFEDNSEYITGSYNEGNFSATENLLMSEQIKIEKDDNDTDYNQSSLYSNSQYYNIDYNPDQNLFDVNQSEARTCSESDNIISMWLPTLECPVCNELCSTFTLLKKHFRLNHHDSAEFYVTCCQSKFNFRCHLERHIRKHLDPKSFKCELCDKRFASKSYLQTHRCLFKAAGGGSGGYSSHGSNQTPSNGSKTTNRIKMFHDMDDVIAKWQPYLKCVVCHRSFDRYSILNVHFRHTHPNENFYVTCCRRKFKRRYKLVDHISVHLDPSFFQCNICGRNLANRDILHIHKLSQHSFSTEKGSTSKNAKNAKNAGKSSNNSNSKQMLKSSKQSAYKPSVADHWNESNVVSMATE